MDNVEKILNNYYENYNEEERLTRDKTHSIEFITTTKYIEKYLNEDDKILEIGAGTGRYSIHYAKLGYQVDSVELVKKNLEILKSKIESNMKINAVQGNCTDLKMYKDNTFDVTLVLGPMYHLYKDEEIDKAMKEIIRVTKENGKILIAYITDDAVVLSYGVRKGNLKKVQEMSNGTWDIPKIEEEIFATYKIEEFNNLVKKYNIKKLETIAVDGIAPQIQEYINNLSNEDFQIYLDYHLKNCTRKDLMGYSSHILEIVEKNKE